jgi:hypothetical protein
MPAGWIAAIGALAGGVSQFSAGQSASKANKASLAAEEERIKNLEREIAKAQRAAGEMRDERDVPSERFGEVLRQYPGLLAAILPQLEKLSIGSANRLTDNNVQQFLGAREEIAPGTAGLSGSLVRSIQSLNPENMGQDEIAAITRKLAPLLPAGTLDPQTGSVQGVTKSPASLYRNLISGEYNNRRNQFISTAGGFLGEQNNAAARQQVSAAAFLDANLSRGMSTSLALASEDVAQQQGDIDAQEAYIRLAASGLASGYDPSANNAVAASSYKGATDSLALAAQALATTDAFGGNNQNRKGQI